MAKSKMQKTGLLLFTFFQTEKRLLLCFQFRDPRPGRDGGAPLVRCAPRGGPRRLGDKVDVVLENRHGALSSKLGALLSQENKILVATDIMPQPPVK